jgi:hypothetical protein
MDHGVQAHSETHPARFWIVCELAQPPIDQGIRGKRNTISLTMDDRGIDNGFHFTTKSPFVAGYSIRTYLYLTAF